MAIIVVVTSVVLASHSRFGGVVQLDNLAYDVALSIRQAQVYGISVQRFGASTFSAGYGVHFNSSSPTTYAIFADVDSNGIMASGQSELVKTTAITGGYRIQSICATAASNGSEICNPYISKIDILFIRPEPNAWIRISDTSGVLQGGSYQGAARIRFSSPRGDVRDVVVDASGQISVRRAAH